MNGTHQLLVSTDDIIMFGEKRNTFKNTVSLFREYMVMSCHHNAGQNHNLLTANKSSENVAKFKCFITTEVNQIFIYEEIKSRLNSGIACNHPVQNLLSSLLLSKTLKD
jgi:hypothetical protein